MRVCIDIQSVIDAPAGVGRYTLELVRALSRIVEDRSAVTLSFFNFLGRYRGPGWFPHKEIKIIPGRVYNMLWKTFHFPPVDRLAGRFDVYHFPNFCLPPTGRGRFIITVHDLAFVRYPAYIERRNLAFLRKELPGSLKRADKIIAVSRFTKREIMELYGVPEEKIVVIYEGVSAGPGGYVPFKLPEKYILCVSTLEPRKNIEGLIDAFNICRLKGYKLLITGKKGWYYDKILQKAEKNPDVILTGYVTQDALYAIYRNARAFVFPSFYEGFGLPPLEAMACGVPVVSSEFEALGDAARFIDPYNPLDIADGIYEVLDNPNPYISKGIKQARGFSWEKAAGETLKLYEDCCRL